jgi:hypothetical protein
LSPIALIVARVGIEWGISQVHLCAAVR